MDHKKVLSLHFVNNLSGREIADSCSDCSKTAVSKLYFHCSVCEVTGYKRDKVERYREQFLIRVIAVIVL